MIKIEQIRLLEERVLGIVSRLDELRTENKSLRTTLAGYQDRIDDLEAKIRTYSDSQAEIEQGILHALKQLDELEDEVTESFAVEEETVASSSADTDDELEVDVEVPVESEEDQSDPELEIF